MNRTRIAGILLAVLGVSIVAYAISSKMVIGAGGNSAIGTIPLFGLLLGIALVAAGLYLAIKKGRQSEKIP